jgi:aldose 1-epimerase
LQIEKSQMSLDNGLSPASVWLSASPLHTLRNDNVTLSFAPSAGGRMTSLKSIDPDTGIEHDWLMPMPEQALRDGFDAYAWPKAGCYPLLPFSNRVRNASFEWNGRQIPLSPHPGQLHAMHGLAHARAWQLDELAGTTATLSLRHVPAGNDWPWPFFATQSLTLSPDALTAVMTLRNDGDHAMPAGGGFHPFFPRAAGLRVRFATTHLWPADEGGVATGRREIEPPEDYRLARALPDTEWSGYYSGWDGEAQLLMPSGRILRIRAGAPLRHLIVYAPAGRDFCCVEPVSHAVDAVNLCKTGLPDTGVQELEPGATMRFEMQLALL